ncbi:MAG: PKD domain-containing protein [Bacteroidetes bacterium]|nr:MAG: PKD domain-containing protein [Bacteroidota bacterium]
MRIFPLLLGFLLVAGPLRGQLATYSVSAFPQAGNPGGVNLTLDDDTTGWTELLTDSLSANTWSAPQTLPFVFDFFGTPVSQLRVSAHGLITFDILSSTVPGPNENLPSASLAGPTIACFWDAFTSTPPTGAGSSVYGRLFGNPGSRQLWLKWVDFEYGDPANDSYNHFACVLEEGTHRIYMVDMAYSGNVPSMSTTVGVQRNALTAVQYGDSTLSFGFANSPLVADNGYYQFDPVVLFARDVALLEIIQPVGPGCYSSAAPVTIRLANVGTDTLTSLTAAFSVDAGLPGTPETIPGPLAPGDSLTYTFQAGAALSTSGAHTLSVDLATPNDGNLANNALAVNLETLVSVGLPLIVNFDMGLPLNWLNDPNDSGENWRSSATGLATHGPGSVDHTTGTGQYMWVDDSSPHSRFTQLLSPCLDLGAAQTPQLSFWVWSENGDTTRDDMRLHLDLQVQGSWHSDVMPPIGHLGPGWQEQVLDLTPYAGASIRLRFRVEEVGTGFSHDIAIDDVHVFESLALDAMLLSIDAPTEDACDLGQETVTVQVYNAGTSPATGMQLSYALNAGPPVAPESLPGTLAPGDTATFTFTALADLSGLGTYGLTAFVLLPGDGDASNDSLTQTLTHLPPVSLPLTESFDSYPTGTTTFPFWRNVPSDALDWQLQVGATASGATGPNDDASGGGGYVYLESSGAVPGARAVLALPCVDLTTVANPYFLFAYHMYGTSIGTLAVLVNDSTGTDTLWQLSGPQQTAASDPWLRDTLDLLPYLGSSVRILVVGDVGEDSLGNSFNGDMAVDELVVKELIPHDVAVAALRLPPPGCTLGSSEAVGFVVENRGILPASGIQATLLVDQVPVAPPELIPGSLLLGDTLSYVFASTVDFSLPGTYEVSVALDYPGDADATNDTLQGIVEHLPAVTTFPYREDFENGAGSWRVQGPGATWTLGAPAKNTIIGAASGTQAWVTGGLGTGSYAPGERSAVLSPCFDLSGITGDVWLGAEIWWETEAGADGAVLQASTDGGETWLTLGAGGAPFNWYNDTSILAQPGGQPQGWSGPGPGGWQHVQHPLPAGLAGSPTVRFRFVFAADSTVEADGFGFDAFVLGIPPAIDLGPDAQLLCPGATLEAGSLSGATYLWSTGATTSSLPISNPAGIYISDSLIWVQVTDSLGLIRRDSIMVDIAPVSPSVSLSVLSPISCFGESDGALLAQGSGGSGPLDFLWDIQPAQTDPTLLNVPAGTYTVTVTDANGCSVTDSLSLSQPPQILVQVDTIIAQSCPGNADGAILITTTGGVGGFSYAWSQGDSTQDLLGLQAGAFTLIVTDSSGCVIVSDTLTVGLRDEDPLPAFSFTESNGTLFFANLSTGGGSYLWDFGDGTNSSDSIPTHTYSQSGQYIITLSQTNPCGTETVSDTAQILLTSLDAWMTQGLRLGPNPAQDHLWLRLEAARYDHLQLWLLSPDGRLMFQQGWQDVAGDWEMDIPLSANWARGLYLLRIQTERGQFFRRIRLE